MLYIPEFCLSNCVVVASSKIGEIKINSLKKINKFKILLHLKDQSSEFLLRERNLAF